jgi:NADPH:quinone reductase-like Zn-dependent oxidoreductase
MKQYLLEPRTDGPAEVVLREIEPPALSNGEVRVRIEACSLNYRDLLMKSGQSASGGSDPVVPLSDGAGVVIETGPEVAEWKIGDRVALTFFRDWKSGRFQMQYHTAARGGSCDGVLAESVVAPEHSLVRVPDYLSTSEAAALPCAAVTAWHAMMERGHRVGVGDTILCLGTGGVSMFALQIAKAAGARVIITSSSDEKLAEAAALGADETINYRTTPDWDREVYARTEKRGVDGVIEVGGPGTLEKSMNSVAAGGFIAQIGVLTGFAPADASLFPIVKKNVDLQGIYVGSREMFERMLAFFEEHRIRPVIDSTFAFADAAAAYSRLESAAHSGKILISG